MATPALTFVFALVALACILSVVRMLSRPPAESRRRGWLVGLLLLVAFVALGLGLGNAVLIQRAAVARRQVRHGRELLQQGKVKEAQEELRRAARTDPRNPDAEKELAEIERRQWEAQQRATQGTGRVSSGGATASKRPHPQRRESQVTIVGYALDVTLLLQEHRLTAEATFGVRSKRGSLSHFEIALSPLCRIEEIAVGGAPAKTLRTEEWVTVEPAARVGDRRPTEVRVRYSGFGKDRMLPGGDVISPEGSYLRPESRWCPAIGYLEFRSPVRVRITVPEGQYALGPGTLRSETRTPSGGATFEWDCPENAMGVCVAAGPWVKLEGSTGEGPEATPISVLLWKQHASQAPALLAMARKAVQYYASLYGPFPYGKLALAEIPIFPGGYGPSSMVLLGEFLFGEHRELQEKVVAHEVAHQWWGNLVLPQGPGAGWLAEGFAEYSSDLYLGHAHGEKAFRRALWDEKQQYHFLMQNPPEEPIIETDPFDQQGGYVGVVYSKGAYVLHMLRYTIGDRAFFATLKGFAQANRYGAATVADFRREAEQQSGRKLEAFFEQWLERTGTAQLTYDWSCAPLPDGRYVTTVTLDQQSRPPYRTPIDVQLVSAGGSALQTVNLTGAHDVFQLTSPTETREVHIDPYDNLLLAVPKRRAPGAPPTGQTPP